MRSRTGNRGLLALTCLSALWMAQCKPRENPPAAGPGVDPARIQGKAEEGPSKGEPSKENRLVLEGKEAYGSCATCHCTTDARIPEDDDWVNLNEETTCVSGADAPRVRESVIAYLRHPETLRPVLVDENFKAEKGRTGEIQVPPAAGSAYLKAERDSIKTGTPPQVRLSWKASEKGKTLNVPVGEYRVINYWGYGRKDNREDERWMTSVTNVDGCTTLIIDADRSEIYTFRGILYGTFSAVRKTDGDGNSVFTLNYWLKDESGNRMTLSRNGKVIFPRWRIMDGDGKEIATGVFGVT